MKTKFDFDYIVIGSGPAGTSAAMTLTTEGNKKVAIVDKNEFGGVNLNSLDVPYAAALNSAHLFYNATNGEKFGFSGISAHLNFPTFTNNLSNIVKKARENCLATLSSAGITTIRGEANFIDVNHVAVGSQQYSAANFIIATGSKLSTEHITGINEVDYLTPESALKISRLPKAICVVGGGSTGCEIAQYFGSLGVKTILIEKSDRILPREENEASKIINDSLTEKLGVVILTNSRVVALEKDSTSKRVVFTVNGSEKMVRVESIVLATGNRPNIDLGLENVGVSYRNSGIIVDKKFQTSTKNIFAVGDVIGGPSSTDIANYQGAFLAKSLIQKTKSLPNYSSFARITKTFPEVACVGYNEDDLVKRDIHYRESIVFLPASIASNITGNDSGFVKILTDKSGLIFGATIVAPNAGCMVQELSLAIRCKLNILDIAKTPHDKNSFNEVIRIAAKRSIGA